jgi:hypothetical protein
MKLNVPNDPSYWQNRAEEAWSIAAEISDAHCKAIMVDIAQSYETIAKSVAERAFEPR